MAPAAAVAASDPVRRRTFAGGSLPLAVLIALVASPFVHRPPAWPSWPGSCPRPGSVATYAARGLHPAVGFLVGWAYVFVEMLVPPLLAVQLGFTAAGTLHAEWSAYPARTCGGCGRLAGAGVIAPSPAVSASAPRPAWVSSSASSRSSSSSCSRSLLIGRAGGANTLVGVSARAHTADGSALGAAGVRRVRDTVLALPPGSRQRRRSPRRPATRGGPCTARFPGGPGHRPVLRAHDLCDDRLFRSPTGSRSSAPPGAASWEGVARASFGLFWVLVFLGGGQLHDRERHCSAANVSTRTAFALARIRVLPGLLATLHPRHRSPWPASPCRPPWPSRRCWDSASPTWPRDRFLLLATVIVTVVVGVYIIVNLSCAGYFLRSGRAAVKPVRHLRCSRCWSSAAFVPALADGPPASRCSTSSRN
ncbi:amino acid permease [Streptomyces tricolor]|nr:amino acid permease [Streptomyces tricolor]